MDKILLNQVARGIKPQAGATQWFLQQSADAKTQVLRYLQYIALQSKAESGDAVKAIEKSGLRPTFTPCILLQNGELRQQIARIVNLPEKEQEKCFLLLLALFAVADARRREHSCKGKCNHWWHRNLADSAVIDLILKEGQT